MEPSGVSCFSPSRALTTHLPAFLFLSAAGSAFSPKAVCRCRWPASSSLVSLRWEITGDALAGKHGVCHQTLPAAARPVRRRCLPRAQRPPPACLGFANTAAVRSRLAGVLRNPSARSARRRRHLLLASQGKVAFGRSLRPTPPVFAAIIALRRSLLARRSIAGFAACVPRRPRSSRASCPRRLAPRRRCCRRCPPAALAAVAFPLRCRSPIVRVRWCACSPLPFRPRLLPFSLCRALASPRIAASRPRFRSALARRRLARRCRLAHRGGKDLLAARPRPFRVACVC